MNGMLDLSFYAFFFILGVVFCALCESLSAPFLKEKFLHRALRCGRSPFFKRSAPYCGVLWVAVAATRSGSSAVCVFEEVVFVTLVVAAAVIDEETGFVPDFIPLTIFILAALCCIFGQGKLERSERIAGLLLAVLIYGGAYLASKAALKREGMGLGDVALMVASGPLLGIAGVVTATLVACVSAAFVLGARAKKGDDAAEGYPFVPFLAVGCLFALAFAKPIAEFYLSLFF